ncbi:formylglycine-generating enzyme family protein [Fimbriiglobus ruber]|uniref:Sulfatase modifying factor 1 (C-alpha-formyglycine-generating enzyme 1) n=1 Tax=Fimbriiglobus ruber TaxID=1908690 RepID=A0A225D5V8_9BACT|nr:formylglycine-generating enzyme family protein [Fimbriiglobus ruber]OWK36971.1 Sulfatase modifying factor 1 precursor (C-alpha-formyglycine- generating enzyme 1) [Fimbriiglobus ruber]
MPKRTPPAPSPKARLGVYIAGGAFVVLLCAFVALSWWQRPLVDEALAEADDVPPEQVWIPGGSFVMGNDAPAHDAADERPAHEVIVNGFFLDKTEVTNGQYAAFVKATGYVTVAERTPRREQYPNADPDLLVPGSAVFVPVQASTDPREWGTPHPPWWQYVPGANWRHPDGPKSSITGRKNYPVVQIAWTDAVAYCEWAGKRLPTEAEWEFAARGGLKQQQYCWGGDVQGQGGVWRANTFQGEFPHGDTAADGYAGLAPVAQYPPNGYGLHDMSGNVWEWCADWYDSKYYTSAPKENPKGPAEGEQDGTQPQRVRRGGSFLCTDSYCRRYVPSARDKNPEDSGASHTGFRCVKDKSQ